MNPFSLAVLSIALSVTAQFFLKAGMASESVRHTMTEATLLQTLSVIAGNGYILSGFLLYGLGAVVWLAVLSQWEVSKAYPLVGLGFVFTLIIGFLLGEQVSVPRVLGSLLICSGVFLITRS